MVSQVTKLNWAMVRSNGSRASGSITVHECAKLGHLAALKKLLEEDSSLVNERSPVILQTPLHVSAGNNRTEIIDHLLNWAGPESVDLEAKNMFGETALHAAAKNGCGEAVEALLIHGACIEARTDKEMTPLHLSVWHSSQVGDISTVRILLGHNADCSAKDNEDMTPLEHVSGDPRNNRLRELLLSHVEERRRVHVLSEVEAKMGEIESAISGIVGLCELKKQLRIWVKGMLLDERRRALGLQIHKRRPPHMVFLGNPGTGKTMVARILGRLLHIAGILPTERVTEVQRSDLVGEFLGHTGPRTRRKIEEAEGGILFVDEAYRLIPNQKADDKDYGLEALEEIMSVMDDGRVVVIFAGYVEPMKRVIGSNEGFCRRVTKFFYFDDFGVRELAEIAHVKMREPRPDCLLRGFRLHRSCSVSAVAEAIERESTERQRREMNGGIVDAMLRNARDSLDMRLPLDCMSPYELVTITLQDLRAGLRSISKIRT